MKEVAARAGVSYQTVSNVLNDHPLVRPATRERVLQAIRELDYQPNFAAKALRAARSMTLTCAFFEHPTEELGDPYRSLIQAAVAHEADKRGYSTLISFVFREQPTTHQQLRRLFQQKRSDGAIIVGPSIDPEFAAGTRHWRMPTVLLDYSGPETAFSTVTADYAGGVHQLVDHLVAQGRRRLALIIAPDQGTTAAERHRGFHEALARHKLPGRVHPGEWSFAAGERAFQQLWAHKPRPDAILAGNDRMAAGCLAAARTLGVRVPKEVAITGFDDFEFARYTAPTLTTIHVPYAEMAAHAVRTLTELIDQPERQPVTHCLPVTLAGRQSA
ncbi:LacI family DNA-binding transcriptional regulator [Deinococcus peraridilitoris]|uniref:Transcriptional regulator n=1 Tax=Deinococcus peraridilitoris (strain DSM 19664 / LMG 22246 / CIP 109416 / KR-200) TaxID=937777 RepID=K9ZZ68_DEIPD|nr:LacI family DNA-binding transcriptional regulator [Deinococcus peraridilitoris]AFZ66891.1 transcriptional regulator [Deinococcus peraridilitoris DSM 19664]